MNKLELTFDVTTKLSKFLDKNYFAKVRDFDDNNTINYVLSENLKKFNPNLNHTFNIFFNENNIKTFKVEYDKIYFEMGKYIFNLYFIPQEYYKTKKEYMDYNCGLLLNKLVSIFNLKYNFTGLYYTYTKNKIYDEFFITKTQEKILELLDLDINTYKHGFKSEEEMFVWLLSSPYVDTNEIISNNKFKNKIYLQFKKYIIMNKIVNIPDISESILNDQIFRTFRNESEIRSFISKCNKQLASLV